MQNLKTNTISDSFALELIFDACRANPARKPVALANGYSVRFNTKAQDGHIAILVNPNDYTVAVADVDKFDC